MMKLLSRAGAVAFLVAVTGGAASAATFSLNDANSGYQSSISKTSDGITMTVEGFDAKNDPTMIYTNYWYGLSVGDHYQDDGEAVKLTFDHMVTLKGFSARFADWGDNYLVYGYDMVAGTWKYITGGNLYGDGSAYSVASVSLDTFASKMFWIDTVDCYDEFKLKKIYAEKVSEVPLPAGAVLLLSGLGVLGLRRRKS